MMEKEGDVLWCLRMFSLLNVGGVWGVPRSGLMFRKESEDPPVLVLIGGDDERDFEAIRDRFALAGILVRRR